MVQTNEVCSNDDQERVYQNCKFHDLWIRGSCTCQLWHGHISYTVKLMHYFFKNLLYSRAQMRQTKYIVLVTKKTFTRILNFMTSRAGVLVVEDGRICHIVKMHFSSKIFPISGLNCCILMIDKKGNFSGVRRRNRSDKLGL